MESSYLKGNMCLIYETGKLGAKPCCSSPMAPSVYLIREGRTFEDPETSWDAELPIVTRPDIAHSINVVSQYMSAPTDH